MLRINRCIFSLIDLYNSFYPLIRNTIYSTFVLRATIVYARHSTSIPTIRISKTTASTYVSTNPRVESFHREEHARIAYSSSVKKLKGAKRERDKISSRHGSSF